MTLVAVRARISRPLITASIASLMVGMLAGASFASKSPGELAAQAPNVCHVPVAGGTCQIIVDPSAAPSPLFTPSPVPTASPTAQATPAPTPTPTIFIPTSTPATPAPTPSAGLVVSPPITVTTNNRTISGVSISTTSQNGYGIAAIGTSMANPIDHLTIENCSISGFNVGISLQYVTNVTIQNCRINGSWYAGILILSGVGGTITGNTITNIGPQSQAASNACNGRGGSGECDSYGITLGRTYTSSSLTTDPRPANWQITNNVVTDVPTWHCYDTHAGQNITFDHDTATRCMRAVFITTDGLTNPGINESFTNGFITEAKSYPAGGTTGGNLLDITLYHLQGGSFTGNQISKSYGDCPTGVDDYQKASTGLTISNTCIP